MARGRYAIGSAAAFLVLAAGASACSSDDAASSTTTTATDAASSSPLEGTWRTAMISPTDAEETLRREDLSEWVEEFRTRAPFEAETVLVLEIGEEWDLYGESSDGTRAEIDYDADYAVDGDEVTVFHSAGSNTFRWEIVGDTLVLEHLETSMPAFEGVPEDVFQHALYMTSAFTRDG